MTLAKYKKNVFLMHYGMIFVDLLILHTKRLLINLLIYKQRIYVHMVLQLSFISRKVNILGAAIVERSKLVEKSRKALNLELYILVSYTLTKEYLDLIDVSAI